jgi:hypothetical protein
LGATHAGAVGIVIVEALVVVGTAKLRECAGEIVPNKSVPGKRLVLDTLDRMFC